MGSVQLLVLVLKGRCVRGTGVLLRAFWLIIRDSCPLWRGMRRLRAGIVAASSGRWCGITHWFEPESAGCDSKNDTAWQVRGGTESFRVRAWQIAVANVEAISVLLMPICR
ncbi:hypothetical protein F5Y17DRAFT_224140 [Xylariaceae sp. FL0594]|nr:hypothetical protein F5Y17DRAFT_224140 [Xylariaceae sp. FL0594]